MDIQAEKLALIEWLEGVNDSEIIRQVRALRKFTAKILVKQLSQAEKDAIDEGLQSLKDGNYKSNEEVKDFTRKKYPHLVK